MIDVSQALAELHAHKSHVELAIQSLEALSYSTANQKRRGRPPKALKSLAIANVISMASGKRRGRPAGSKNAPKVVAVKKKITRTPAQRKAQAAKMRAYWAAKKKAS